MNIAIIGGGASGLFAGGLISKNGETVTIFDGNDKCGKKLYITGKGRCNVTNNCSKDEYLNNVINGKKFMMSAINQFTPQDTISFFEDNGVKLKTERGNRVFPQSDKSSDIIKALISHNKNSKIRLEEKVISITKEDQFKVKTTQREELFDRVIIATGGKSYPATGSDGDGYKFAKIFGHTIEKLHSALVPIKIKDAFCREVEGLSLKNVTLKAQIDGKKVEKFGEMLFTSDAISGPIALSMSSLISSHENVKLSIDFKSALNEEQLENRLLRDIETYKNRNLNYILKGLLPASLTSEFLKRLNVKADIKANSVTREMRKKFVSLLKEFNLEFRGLHPIEAGIVTGGGVSLKEVNPKTMESKLISGLYFIGEVLDVDCLTGGFNLQTAFSTAYACANNLI